MKCPYCKGRSIWCGYRYNMSGKKRMAQCTKCGRKFTPGKYLRMRYKPKVIQRAVRLYRKEKSSAKVQRALAADRIKVSRWTIIKWSRKFKS